MDKITEMIEQEVLKVDVWALLREVILEHVREVVHQWYHGQMYNSLRLHITNYVIMKLVEDADASEDVVNNDADETLTRMEADEQIKKDSDVMLSTMQAEAEGESISKGCKECRWDGKKSQRPADYGHTFLG